ncbi:hypothetical protein EDB83DRAFT_2564841 [Lactarius deliciosus]|nr:hypothetical protein EDB83DRAFT_2564841 [Lactarius deliciosus]
MTTPRSDPLGVTGVPLPVAPVVVQSPPSTTAETDTAGAADRDTVTAGTVDTDTTGAVAVDTDTASTVATVTTGTGHGEVTTQPDGNIVTAAGTTSPARASGDGGGDTNAPLPVAAAQNGEGIPPSISSPPQAGHPMRSMRDSASGADHVMINTRPKRVTICEKTWPKKAERRSHCGGIEPISKSYSATRALSTVQYSSPGPDSNLDLNPNIMQSPKKAAAPHDSLNVDQDTGPTGQCCTVNIASISVSEFRRWAGMRLATCAPYDTCTALIDLSGKILSEV